MKANTDVTEALRRTINLMQGELERSVLSTQMLGSCCHTAHTPRALTPVPNCRRLHRYAAVHIEHLRHSGQHSHRLEAARNRTREGRPYGQTPHNGWPRLLLPCRLVHPEATCDRPRDSNGLVLDSFHLTKGQEYRKRFGTGRPRGH